MKKKLLIILIGLLIIISIGFYFAIPWFKELKKDPTAVIKLRLRSMNMIIKELEKEKTTLDLKLLIDNPTPISFSLDSLNYWMFIGGVEVMKSSYPKGIKMNKNDSTWITLPVTVYNEKMIKRLKELEEKKVDSVEYKIKAEVFADIPFRDKPLFFEFGKKAPVFIIPKIKLKKAKIKKIGLNESKAIFEAEIENPNPVAFRFRKTSYKLKIDKDKMMEGKIDTALIVPKYSKKVIDFPVEVSLKEGAETMFKMLVKPGDVDYYFNFKTTLIADLDMLKDTKLFLEDQGKLKELIKNK